MTRFALCCRRLLAAQALLIAGTMAITITGTITSPAHAARPEPAPL
jgi:hypothetical protein